jgi:hypothetical protein
MAYERCTLNIQGIHKKPDLLLEKGIAVFQVLSRAESLPPKVGSIDLKSTSQPIDISDPGLGVKIETVDEYYGTALSPFDEMGAASGQIDEIALGISGSPFIERPAVPRYVTTHDIFRLVPSRPTPYSAAVAFG